MQPGIPYKRYACRCSKAKVLKITSSDGQRNFTFRRRMPLLIRILSIELDRWPILRALMKTFYNRYLFFSITLRSLIPQALLESEVVTSPINFTAKPAEKAKDSATAFVPTLFLNPLRVLCALRGLPPWMAVVPSSNKFLLMAKT